LETAANPTGPWQPVPSARSPHSISAVVDCACYRVRIPLFPLTITKAGSGSGTVVSQPAGIECGSDCKAWFSQDTVVTLTATASTGSRFVSWDGDAAGTGPCDLVLSEAKSVTATFELEGGAGGLLNGDFEQGTGAGWVEQPSGLVYSATQLGMAVPSGQYAARLGWAADDRHTVRISQQVTLPQLQPLYLNYWLLLYSEEICDAGYWDTVGFYVDGQPLVQNSHLCHDNTGGEGWRQTSVDLSNFAGQTVTIAFEISSAWYDPLASVLYLDALSLSQTAW
jgi:hypothetical protein